MASQALRQGVALLGVSVVLATIAMHISQEHRLELVDISAPGYYVTTANLGAHNTHDLHKSFQRPDISAPGGYVTTANLGAQKSHNLQKAFERPDISAPGYYVTTGNLGAHDVQKPVKRPVVTFGQSPYRIYFDNEKRRTKREPVHDMGRDNELDVRPHRAVPEITFDKEAIKTTRNSASQATIEKWKNYKQKKEAEKLVDPCTNPGSMCSLIKHLNSEHLGGVISTGGEGWTPGAEVKKQARIHSAITEDADADPSLCDTCISHALADAGPARFIAGRTIEQQARQGTCAPLCTP